MTQEVLESPMDVGVSGATEGTAVRGRNSCCRGAGALCAGAGPGGSVSNNS